MKITRKVHSEILKERRAQVKKWGGPTHDDTHLRVEWVRFMEEHLFRARKAQTAKLFRRQVVRVAALAVAALESYDRGDKRMKKGISTTTFKDPT